MCQISKPNSFVVISVASTGRVEIALKDLVIGSSEIKMITIKSYQKDFINNFDLNIYFPPFFYHFDLFVLKVLKIKIFNR